MVVLEILFYSLNKGFIILVWITFIPLIYLFKRKRFFKTAEFCYGEIIDVTLDDSDDVHRTFKITFIDSTKITHETYICEHWGDYDEEFKDQINNWYEEGKKSIGKKIPLFYKGKNPNKNIVFYYNSED